MKKTGLVGFAAIVAFAGAHGFVVLPAQAPAASAQIPNLAGIWDGGGRARPVNSETVPWGKDNFPVLNERALAYQRSEEHTSELQSRGLISYAVFCLKKNKKIAKPHVYKQPARVSKQEPARARH